MSAEPGHSNAETKLKADGTPDHRFKEVSSRSASTHVSPPLLSATESKTFTDTMVTDVSCSTEAEPTATRAVARPVSRRLAMVHRV